MIEMWAWVWVAVYVVGIPTTFFVVTFKRSHWAAEERLAVALMWPLGLFVLGALLFSFLAIMLEELVITVHGKFADLLDRSVGEAIRARIARSGGEYTHDELMEVLAKLALYGYSCSSSVVKKLADRGLVDLAVEHYGYQYAWPTQEGKDWLKEWEGKKSDN